MSNRPDLQNIEDVNDGFEGSQYDHSMTNSLRIKIAESLGLRQFYLMKRGLYYRPYGHGYTACRNEAWVLSEEEADKHVYPHDEPITKHPVPVPDYDTDANAALQLVEVLKKEGWRFMYDNIGTLAEAEFFKSGPRVSHLGHAPTLPEAICLAYAKVKGIEL